MTLDIGRQLFALRSVVAEVVCVGPDAIAGHVEPFCQRLTPLGCGGWFVPVVGDADGSPGLQFADGHVSVQASVAVVAGPLDHDDIVELQTPADFECELGEVAPTSATSRLERTISSICGHWRATCSANGTPRMYATRVAPSDS